METIKDYLDNMFMSLTSTPEIRRIRDDLLETMEDKYNELKAEGKSENEAIGIVISEFGNIDELLQEMEIPGHSVDNDLPFVDLPFAEGYLADERISTVLVATGVALCLLGVSAFIFFSAIPALPEFTGLMALFICIASAVGIFIYSGTRLEKYEFLKYEFNISSEARGFTQMKREAFRAAKNIYLILGIIIFILSPMVLIMLSYTSFNEDMIVVPFLLMIALGVFLVIYSSGIDDSYKKLLQIEKHAPRQKESDRVIGAVAAVWWPICTVAYLAWSFIGNAWRISWIVWPVAGVLFGAFSGAYSIIKEDKSH